MKAPSGRIWEAASKDESRTVLTHVAFDAKKGTLTATNSYILARVPCEVEEGDQSGLIPAAALKEANGRSLKVADGKATLKLADGERSWDLLVGTFPDVDKVLADTLEAPVKFGIDARLLNNLGVALWGGSLVAPLSLHPVHPLRGMLVTGPQDTVGVIMPVRLAGSNGARPALALSDDDAVVAAARAAVAAIERKRGKKRAAQAFRDALAEAAS